MLKCRWLYLILLEAFHVYGLYLFWNGLFLWQWSEYQIRFMCDFVVDDSKIFNRYTNLTLYSKCLKNMWN